MWIRLVLLTSLIACAGCEQIESIVPELVNNPDGAVPPDLTPPQPKCAAAAGLSGDILGGLCLDMTKTDTAMLTSLGFNLGSPMTNCSGWGVSSGNLQPQGINTAQGTVICALLFPAIPIDAKYSQIMLSLVHQVTVPGPNQQATIALPAATPKPLWVWIDSGISVAQRTIVEIAKTEIPPPSGSPFQPTFQIYAPGTTTAPSWTISSLAVLGIP